jgi:hypothetical protein
MAVVLGNFTRSNPSCLNTSHSFSHTAAAGDNRVVIVWAASQHDVGSANPSTYTYDGNTMNIIAGSLGAVAVNQAYWYAAGEGSKTISFTWTNSARTSFAAVDVSGADLTSPIFDSQYTRTSGSSISQTCSVEANSQVIDNWCWSPYNEGKTIGADQTQYDQIAPHGSSGIRYGASYQDSDVDGVMSWSGATSATYSHIAVSIRNAASGVTPKAIFFSLAGISIPAATLAGLYKAGAVAL